jgi:hypothetical protein
MPLPVLLLMDIVSTVLTVGPGAVTWTALVLLVRHFWPSPLLPLVLLAVPIVAPLLLIAVLAAARLLFPRLRPGVYRMKPSVGLVAWYCQFALNRAARICGLWPLINTNAVLKWLYFRAMGARIAFGINTSLGITLVDLPLLTIGPGCTLAEGAHIACHTFVGDRLALTPVTIGRDVLVGMNTVIGPATSVGDGAWIGMSNLLGNTRLEPGQEIKDFEWASGDPRAKEAA